MFEGRRTSRRNRTLSQAVEALETRRLLATTIFSADFENGLAAARMASPSMTTATGLWHVSSVRSQTPTHSIYYGRDAQRDSRRGHHVGAITSPNIDLPVGSTSPQLKFDYFLAVERLTADAEDIIVDVTTNGGTTGPTLASNGYSPLRLF